MSRPGFGPGRTTLVAAGTLAAVLIALFSVVPSSGRASKMPTRALWAWSWDAPSELADFTAAEGFDRVYLYCQGGFTPGVRATIGLLARRGVRVEALGGETNWATNGRDGMLRFIRSARRYQHHASGPARLDGIHLDVEPHALKAWTRRPGRTRRAFLGALGAARRAAGPLPVAADLPFWFDGITLRFRGRHQTLSAAALRQLDAATIMAYRDRPADIIAVSRLELGQAARLGKPLTVGVETGATSPGYLTFFEEGRAALEQALARIDAVLGGKPSFAGIAVHSYGSLKTLSP